VVHQIAYVTANLFVFDSLFFKLPRGFIEGIFKIDLYRFLKKAPFRCNVDLALFAFEGILQFIVSFAVVVVRRRLRRVLSVQWFPLER